MAWDPKLPIDPVHKAVQVEGVAGGTPVPVSGTFTATTSAKATAAAPTYVEGTDSPISQDLSGNLRTLASATTTAKATAADPAYAEGADSAISQDRTGHLRTTGLTDTQLRASAVPVSGPLTDTQLRASAVPISGALTDTQLRATAVPVSGPLTDTQLRATAVPVSGTVTSNQGTAAAASSAWPVKITDTSDVAVKPGDATNNAIRVNVVASTGSTTFFGITESSTGDGTTATLTLGHTPTDEPRIFVARIRQILNTDYTRVGAVITWIVIPANGDQIQVDYTWSMASATLTSTLVVDTLGNVQPTGDSSARTIHTTVDNPIFGTVESGSGQTATAVHVATQTPRGADVGLVVRQVPDTAFQQILIGLLTEIRMEMRITNELLVEGLTLRKSHDPEQLRRDPTYFESLSFSQPS